MNIFTKEFKRTARRNWCCDQCHKDLYLIAKDWQGSKYHWKVCLWTTDGDLLKTSNVRFV